MRSDSDGLGRTRILKSLKAAAIQAMLVDINLYGTRHKIADAAAFSASIPDLGGREIDSRHAGTDDPRVSQTAAQVADFLAIWKRLIAAIQGNDRCQF